MNGWRASVNQRKPGRLPYYTSSSSSSLFLSFLRFLVYVNVKHQGNIFGYCFIFGYFEPQILCKACFIVWILSPLGYWEPLKLKKFKTGNLYLVIHANSNLPDHF
ncbi:hypothetical protein AMTRI_Chr09g16090 [Amborella trichopoda]